MFDLTWVASSDLLTLSFDLVSPFSHQVPGEEFKLERTFDYVSPGKMYTVVGGEKKVFTLH